MHERTRLFVCRAGFVFACLLPTILTTSAISYFRSDVYLTARREEWVALFSQKLGMKVEIDALSYPDLSTALLKGVRLRDSETDALVCEAYHVEVMRLDDGNWDVEFDLPMLMTESLPALQQRLHDRLFAELPGSFPEIRCRAKRMSLGGETQVHLQDVELNVFVSEKGPAAQCLFRIYGVQTAKPFLAEIYRHRDNRVARSHWDFSTEESDIPCEVLAIFAPALSKLGNRATMNGSATGSIGRQEESLAFRGVLRNVSLEHLSDGRVPLTPKLGKGRERWLARGLATIDVQNLHLKDGHVEQCEASLIATQTGFLGSELVEAAKRHLDLQGVSPAATSARAKPSQYPFGELAFDLVLEERGFRVIGKASSKDHGNGVIASHAKGGVLLEETEPHWIPQIALVQFLAPHSDQSIPANPTAAKLLEHLSPPRVLPGARRALQTERPTEETLK